MVVQMFPLADSKAIRQALMDVREYADANGELDVAAFQDVVAVIMEFFAKRFEAGDMTAALDDYSGVSDAFSTKIVRGTRALASKHLAKKPMVVDPASGRHPTPIGTPRLSAELAASRGPVTDPNASFDATASSMVLITTSNGRKNVASISGSNLPEALRQEEVRLSNDATKKTTVATCIARLLSDGFKIATTTPDTRPGELVFVLVRDGPTGGSSTTAAGAVEIQVERAVERSIPQVLEKSIAHVLPQSLRRRSGSQVKTPKDEARAAPHAAQGSATTEQLAHGGGPSGVQNTEGGIARLRVRRERNRPDEPPTPRESPVTLRAVGI